MKSIKSFHILPHTFFLLTVLFVIVSCCSCSASKSDDGHAANNTQSNQHSHTTVLTDRQRAAQILADMTTEQKVGQLFLVRPESLSPSLSDAQANDATHYGVTALSDEMRTSLISYPVGGIALFGKNISGAQQLPDFITSLQDASSVPLFIGVDEEGGRVARIANSSFFDVTKYESMQAVGDSGDPQKAKEVGLTIGGYLKPLGFNLDFAPDADVFTNPSNLVIGDRSFGSDPKLVGEMVCAQLTGMHEAGIMGCIKHFPGHGDTKGDTHTGYVSVSKTWEELKACELVPFCAALPYTDMVMVAHITAVQVSDDGLPASLSKEIITGKLRDELGYDGVVITDSMSMGAITEDYTSAESALLALQAGADIVLMPRNLPDAFQGVLQAVEQGNLSTYRLDESVLRILTLKVKYGLLPE